MTRRLLPVLLIIAGLAAVAFGSGLFRGSAELSLPPTVDGATWPTAAPSPPPSPNATPSTTPVDLMAIGRANSAKLPTGIVPARIRIPAIGVDAPVVDLGYESATEIEVPSTAEDAGWFTPSRRPGEIGPAIIAGHVDLGGGPAVFYRLREVRPGDEVVVTDATGASRTFVVERLGQYPKSGLPDDVFGFGGAVPELRLITCGGVFNRETGHYEDNIVAYARLEES